MDAPYHDPGWTIWTCSMHHLIALPEGGIGPDIPRWDAWFELHIPFGLHQGSGTVPDDYVEWLRTQPLVYVRDPQETFPGARVYPEVGLKTRFGPYFFNCSISYMMALAIHEGPQEIGLWGVGMMNEHAYQKPGCHYFTQRARESGITVSVPEGSTLLDPPKEDW